MWVTLQTLHIHLDESGDLNFSPNGTRYFIFGCAWTYEPAPLANELNALRFTMVKEGHGERLSGFHFEHGSNVLGIPMTINQINCRHCFNGLGVINLGKLSTPKNRPCAIFQFRSI